MAAPESFPVFDPRLGRALRLKRVRGHPTQFHSSQKETNWRTLFTPDEICADVKTFLSEESFLN